MIAPHCQTTAEGLAGELVVLCVGDTTYLDYGQIIEKREGYSPTGNGGNGLILHSGLALEAQSGQPLGLLWQKLWNRQAKAKAPRDETPEQRKQRQAAARKAARQRPFEEKESYRWVEALTTVERICLPSTRIIHVFDREGDIAEVFDEVEHCCHSGVVVRAAHNRSLEPAQERLWAKLEAQPIRYTQRLSLPPTARRDGREATLAVRFCPVQLRPPNRLQPRGAMQVYGVYALEVDAPEGETPVAWLLLTTETLTTDEQAAQILRWYTYRWRVEEYHKLLKSGCKAERYRLAAESMKTCLGFLCVVAVELLRLTYLNRTQPDGDINLVLNETQQAVLKAKAQSRGIVIPAQLTVGWAIEQVARLGGYLEHRRKTPIGIQVLWRGWLKLHDLCEGWELASPS